MLNKVTLIGNLGKDPELKTVGQGTSVCSFTVACAEKWKDKATGQMNEKTEWVNVTAWRDLAEIVKKYCSKGDKVYVEGRLETQSWADKTTGEKKYKTIVLADKVLFLSQKRTNGAPPAQHAGGGFAGNGGASADDDDLPF